jgi:hypothetical protein
LEKASTLCVGKIGRWEFEQASIHGIGEYMGIRIGEKQADKVLEKI